MRRDIVVKGVRPALGRPCRPGRLLQGRGRSHSRDQTWLISLQQGMRWPGLCQTRLLQPGAHVPVRPRHQVLLRLLLRLLGLLLLLRLRLLWLGLRLAVCLRCCRRSFRGACSWTVIVQLDVKLVILQTQPCLACLRLIQISTFVVSTDTQLILYSISRFALCRA